MGARITIPAINLRESDDRIDTASHLNDTSDAHNASAISNVAAGNIAATDVQAALNELDTEKAKLAGLSTQAFATAALTVTSANVVVSSGFGIDFTADAHATGKTSELLDDYEEGTWTPILTGASGAPTYNVNTGLYTKIGRLVKLSGAIHLSGIGTLTGAVSIAGMPFALGGAIGAESCLTFSSSNDVSSSKNRLYGGTASGGAIRLELFDNSNPSYFTYADATLFNSLTILAFDITYSTT